MKNREEIILSGPLFDGRRVIENAAVVIKDGIITSVREAEKEDEKYFHEKCFLMPGLIDAHTHINTLEQTEMMLKCGITAACDVAAAASVVEQSKQFTLISSAGMTMGTLKGKAYVSKALDRGASYIKVLLMEPNLMLGSVLQDICSAAHENGIKVAVHAVSVKAVSFAVSCGADILLHVPMKEKFPRELAETIAAKKIAVAPTLVMMQAFSDSKRKGGRGGNYQNAEDAVGLLHECGVQILAATDANNGSYAPPVEYGTSLYREMQLLVKAGMTPCEALAGATGRTAEVFGIDGLGSIAEGKRATFLLICGRPDKSIADVTKIRQVWINGIPLSDFRDF